MSRLSPATLASTRRKRRPVSHRAVGHTGHVAVMSGVLGLVTWFSCLKMLLQLLLWYYLLTALTTPPDIAIEMPCI